MGKYKQPVLPVFHLYTESYINEIGILKKKAGNSLSN